MDKLIATGNTVPDNGLPCNILSSKQDNGTTPTTPAPNSTAPNGGLIVNGNCNAVKGIKNPKRIKMPF